MIVLLALACLIGWTLGWMACATFYRSRVRRLSRDVDAFTGRGALEASKPWTRVRVLVHRGDDPFPKNVFEEDVDGLPDRVHSLLLHPPGGSDLALAPGDELQVQLLVGALDVYDLVIVRSWVAPGAPR